MTKRRERGKEHRKKRQRKRDCVTIREWRSRDRKLTPVNLAAFDVLDALSLILFDLRGGNGEERDKERR